MTKISVLVPAFNEESTIIEVLKLMKAQKIDGVNFEIIVINDGSQDGMADKLESNPGLYDKLEHNQGKGSAVLAGLGEASGDYVLFQDVDLEYDPAALRTVGWEQQAEILTLAAKKSQRIYEEPNYYGRTYDEGKKIRAHHAVSDLWTIVTTRLGNG